MLFVLAERDIYDESLVYAGKNKGGAGVDGRERLLFNVRKG